jgi:hypothetical protein
MVGFYAVGPSSMQEPSQAGGLEKQMLNVECSMLNVELNALRFHSTFGIQH